MNLRPREAQVLALIAEGATSRQIASNLGLASRTVAIYRQRLLLKFDVPNTPALISAAFRQGFLE